MSQDKCSADQAKTMPAWYEYQRFRICKYYSMFDEDDGSKGSGGNGEGSQGKLSQRPEIPLLPLRWSKKCKKAD